MSRIGSALARRKALIGYVTVGYPSLEATLEVVPLLAGWGCDVIELGIPFSDPLADGTTIQEAAHRALANGVTPRLCLEVAAELRRKVAIPLVFMTYCNPVLSLGPEAFCRLSAEGGLDGLIVPDLPPEEGGELETCCAGEGMDLIYLLAPTSSQSRIDLVSQRSRGFIYLVSLAGVTGARQDLPPDLESFVGRVRKRAALPLCVGFGISTPEQAGRAARVADGVIVGSRLLQLMDGRPYRRLGELVAGMREALDAS
ncbi:MAG: tryptophan synthase subunit alpha [Chloroflexi bacterium]|nr:tryptophan synthase subunit alpha [Chloroflexota bacterium]